METINLASVDPATRNRIKNQTVQLHLLGKKHDEIVETLGISYDAVSRIVRAYQKNGKLTEKKTRGRKKGEKRTLSAVQEQEIQRIIIDKCPDQVKLGFALWTRNAVMQLIHTLYGIDMPLRSVSNYLMRWGMTYQFPPKNYFGNTQERDFMRRAYPFILKVVKKEKAALYWGGEWALNKRHNARYDNNMLFAINGRGTFRFMCFRGNIITPQLFKDFLSRLVIDCQGQRVCLIFDKPKGYYTEEPLYSWLNNNLDRIKVYAYPCMIN